MPHLKLNDTLLYFELHGSGPPLMLIAGLASDSQSWQPVIGALAEKFTLIIPDNCGVGRSTQHCKISISRMANDCKALLDHLGMGKANLLGHSMGGMVAMECAIRYPLTVNNLLLVATTPRNSARNNLLFDDWATTLAGGTDPVAWLRSLFYWIFTERFFENQLQVNETISYLINYPWPQSAQAFRAQVEAIASFDATDSIGSITAPTRVIAGAEDILMQITDSAILADQIPGASLTVLKGAAHSKSPISQAR